MLTGPGAIYGPLLTVAVRTMVAPTFYACAYSFTRFLLVRAGGPRAFVARVPELPARGLEATVLSATGQPLAAARREWHRRLWIEGVGATP